MKKTIKFLCVICMISLCVSFASIFVYAAEPTVSFRCTDARKGETVTVTVVLSDCPKVKSLGIIPIYDEEKLEYISGEWLIGDALLSDWSDTDQNGVIAYASEKDINGNVAKMSFRIKDISSWDDIPFSCNVVLKNESGDVHVTTVGLDISIICDHIWGTEEHTKPSTCSQNGCKYVICTLCNEENKILDLEKLEHSPSDWIIDREATKDTNGEKHKECTVCQEILETESIAKKSEEDIKDPPLDVETTDSDIKEQDSDQKETEPNNLTESKVPTGLIIAAIIVGSALVIAIVILIIVILKRSQKH